MQDTIQHTLADAPAQEPKKRSLEEIDFERMTIEELFREQVIANEGELTPDDEAILDEWIKANEKQLESKLEGYVFVMKENEQEAKILDGRVKAFAAMAEDERRLRTVRENRVKSLKARLKWFYETRNITSLKAGPYKINLENNGGDLPMVLAENLDLSQIPERFLKPREIDEAAVKAALKAGEELDFASFGGRGRHIRIR